jgi:hypothetical protein
MRIMSMPCFSCIQAKALLESGYTVRVASKLACVTCQAIASALTHLRSS